MSPTSAGDVQPQCSPSVSPTMSAMSAAESRSAPGTSTRDGVRIGDSGTYLCTSRIDSATGIEPRTKSSRHERWSTITPESTMPKPPPTPKIAERMPMPTGTRSGGNSSRMIANERGKSAPPAPDSARKAISDHRFHAKAAPMQPTRKIERLIRSMRSLPNWSPSLPRTGVVTAAETRNAVSTHVTHAVVPPSSRWNSGQRGEHHRLLKREGRPREHEDGQREGVVLSPPVHRTRLSTAATSERRGIGWLRPDPIRGVDDRLDPAQAVVAHAREERYRLPPRVGEVEVRVLGRPGLERGEQLLHARLDGLLRLGASARCRPRTSGTRPRRSRARRGASASARPRRRGGGSRPRGAASRPTSRPRRRRSRRRSCRAAGRRRRRGPGRPDPCAACESSVTGIVATVSIAGPSARSGSSSFAPSASSPSQIACTTTNDLPRTGSGISGIGGNCRMRPTEVISSGTSAVQVRQAFSTSRRPLDREPEDARVDLGDRQEVELDRGDDAEGAAAAAERPEEVGLVLRVGADEVAVRGDELDRGHLVGADAVLAGEPREAAAERVADDADIRRGACERGEAVLGRRLDDLDPDHARLGARGARLGVDRDAAHARRPYEDRVREVAHGARRRGRFPGERGAGRVLAREHDDRGHIGRVGGQRNGRRPLVDGEVPGLPRLVPARARRAQRRRLRGRCGAL